MNQKTRDKAINTVKHSEWQKGLILARHALQPVLLAPSSFPQPKLTQHMLGMTL
jgi:hypothetical protein